MPPPARQRAYSVSQRDAGMTARAATWTMIHCNHCRIALL
jgi:hypothetical protein